MPAGSSILHLFIALSAGIGQLAIGNELPIACDSTGDNYSSNFVMDASDAELIQRHLHEQRGRVGENLYFFLGRHTDF